MASHMPATIQGNWSTIQHAVLRLRHTGYLSDTKCLQAKSIEDCPAATPDGSTPSCAWAKAQTIVTARLELQEPFYPPWQPPPLPAVTLQQLIPKREFVKKEERPTASQAFQSDVQAAARQLAVDYHKVSLYSGMLM